MRFFMILVALAVMTSLVACTSISTITPQKLGDNDVDPGHFNGLLYYLPRGLVHIVGGQKQAANNNATKSSDGSSQQADTSSQSGSQGGTSISANYTITISPYIEPDPQACFFLKPDRNYLFDDSVDVKIDSNGLLTSGKATAKDETVQIIGATVAMIPQAGILSAKTTWSIGDMIALVQKYPPSSTIPLKTFQDIVTTLNGLKIKKSAIADDFVASLSDPVSVAQIKVYLEFYQDDSSTDVGKAYEQLRLALVSAQNPPKPFDILFDPASPSDIVRARGIILKACNFDLHVYPPSQSVSLSFGNDGLPDVIGNKHSDGIAFRPTIAYSIVLLPEEGNANTSDCRKVVLLPDCHTTLLLDYSRMPFVQKDTNLGFSNGMLTEFSQSVPSPILGVLGIPKAILQAILPIPQPAAKTSGTSAAKESKE